MNKTDLIVIGAGPGGYRAALAAAAKGLSVTVIEEAHAGGTCLNCGCIPTKAFCRNAEVLDTVRRADVFGISAGAPAAIDFTKVAERKNSVVAQLRGAVEALMKRPGINFVRGHATFKNAKTVVVTPSAAVPAAEEEFSADNIIIATGSRPAMPPIDGISLPGVVTSTGLLDVPALPRRLCIIGAGVIGMEFASAFNSFGSQVAVVEFLKEALPTMDSDIAKRLRQTIARRGVTFFLQSCVKSIAEVSDAPAGTALRVSFEQKGKAVSVDADLVLVATGRAPCADKLGLENAGVEFNRKGIHTDENFRTNVPGIYAIGDVNGRCMLAHAATFQGLHVVNEITGTPDKIRPEIMPAAVFTNPEAASVGLGEDAAKVAGTKIVCRKGFYRANGKALAMNETEGLVKLVADAESGRILGCHAFGAHAADIVQEVAVLMNADATLAALADIVHIHPTLSEILHDAAC